MNTLNHVAIIMDGNGRWAQLKKKPRVFGHIKGARVAKKIITEASDKKIGYLTLYTFSSENWERPFEEVQFLMKLLERYLEKETDNLVRKNIKFSVIGEIDKLPLRVKELVVTAKDKTQNCTGLKVCFALSYGSRSEIIGAVKSIVEQIKFNKLSVDEINEELISKNLMTKEFPDPDLVIRTSGELRLSNFLMWQCSYSELFFSKTLWPDFSENEFNAICEDFQNRHRRFGKVIDLNKNEEFLKQRSLHSAELAN